MTGPVPSEIPPRVNDWPSDRAHVFVLIAATLAGAYDRGAGGPVWIDAAGKPAAQARAGLTLLDHRLHGASDRSSWPSSASGGCPTCARVG